jgi:DNA invertase Pin-like site-specific DNA recombinase
MTVRCYARVSTDRQAGTGYGLEAQQSAIEREAEHRGWTDVQWYIEREGRSGSSMDRPEMTRLLRDVRRGDVLVAAKVDRLSRSLVDFATLVETAQRRGWTIVTLDLGLDLSTAQGEFVASVLAAFARMERRLISQRTRDAMAAAKARGVLPGPRSALPSETRARIVALRSDGLALSKIAARLNDEEVWTVTGKRWRAQSVHAALRTIEREAEAAEILTQDALSSRVRGGAEPLTD